MPRDMVRPKDVHMPGRVSGILHGGGVYPQRLVRGCAFPGCQHGLRDEGFGEVVGLLLCVGEAEGGRDAGDDHFADTELAGRGGVVEVRDSVI